jgi:hypothetical protein
VAVHTGEDEGEERRHFEGEEERRHLGEGGRGRGQNFVVVVGCTVVGVAGSIAAVDAEEGKNLVVVGERERGRDYFGVVAVVAVVGVAGIVGTAVVAVAVQNFVGRVVAVEVARHQAVAGGAGEPEGPERTQRLVGLRTRVGGGLLLHPSFSVDKYGGLVGHMMKLQI